MLHNGIIPAERDRRGKSWGTDATKNKKTAQHRETITSVVGTTRDELYSRRKIVLEK